MQAMIGDGTRTWVRLDPDVVHGRGLIAPRLAFHFMARTPRERMQVQVQLMSAELRAKEETLGHGMLTGASIVNSETQLILEIPVSRAALEHIDRSFAAGPVELSLQLSGWLRVRDDNDDNPAFASAPPVGEWIFEGFGFARQTELRFQIARSDWFERALEPIATVDYLVTEIAIPRGDSPLRQSANHLRDAERALRAGTDAQVFASCRAAVDTLPGWPKEIFARLEFEREAESLDELVKAAGEYFHIGRHPADQGPREGEFPVDHGDAAFALNLTKLLLAHTARVLARPPR